MTTDNTEETTPEFTAEEMETAGLTETEIAALGDGVGEDVIDDESDITDELVDTDELEVKAEDDDTTDDKTDDTTAEEGDTTSEADETTDETTEEETTGEGEAEAGDDAGELDTAAKADADNKQFLPQFKADAPEPEEYQAKMDDIGTRMEELGDQLDQGDITAKEFQTANIALMQEREALNSAVAKAEMYQEINQQNAEQMWQNEQDMFFASDAAKVYEDNGVLFAAFNEAVKEVARDDGFANTSGTDILQEAHRRVTDMIGGNTTSDNADTTSEETPNKESKAKDELEARRAAKQGKEKVVTLGGLPAADGTDTSGGEFAGLDSLNGMELEAAVNRLSPEQQERYYRS